MSRIVITEIQKRFADVDVFGHVNNIHQQQYLDLGKTDYYNRVIGFDVHLDRIALMIVAVNTDFIGQIRYDDQVYVKTRVKAVGTKSITIAQQIVCRLTDGTEEVRTQGETVLVTFDRKEQHTVEVPQSWRDRIDEFKNSGI